MVARADVEGSEEGWLTAPIVGSQCRQLQNVSAAHAIIQYHLLVMEILTTKTTPLARQWPVTPTITTHHTKVVRETAGLRTGPARTIRVARQQQPADGRVNLMLPVKLNPPPVNKIPLGIRLFRSTPGSRHPQRVSVKQHPVPATGNAPRTGIQSHRQTLLRNVVPGGRYFVRMRQRRTIIHRIPGLNCTGFRPP